MSDLKTPEQYLAEAKEKVSKEHPLKVESWLQLIANTYDSDKPFFIEQAALLALQAQAEDYKELLSVLGELLAIMHGDGGHHENKVGTKQAVKDAIELLHKKWVTNEHLVDINNVIKENDQLKAELSRITQEIESQIQSMKTSKSGEEDDYIDGTIHGLRKAKKILTGKYD